MKNTKRLNEKQYSITMSNVKDYRPLQAEIRTLDKEISVSVCVLADIMWQAAQYMEAEVAELQGKAECRDAAQANERKNFLLWNISNALRIHDELRRAESEYYQKELELELEI